MRQQPLTFMLGNGFPCNALTTRGKALVGAEGGPFSLKASHFEVVLSLADGYHRPRSRTAWI